MSPKLNLPPTYSMLPMIAIVVHAGVQEAGTDTQSGYLVRQARTQMARAPSFPPAKLVQAHWIAWQPCHPMVWGPSSQARTLDSGMRILRHPVIGRPARIVVALLALALAAALGPAAATHNVAAKGKHDHPPIVAPQPTPSPSPSPSATLDPSPTPSPAPAPLPVPTVVPSPTAPPIAPPPSGSSGFVTRVGTSLYLNGSPYRFVGLNIYNANSDGSGTSKGCSYALSSGSGLDSSLTAIGSGQEAFRAWFFQGFAITNGGRDWSAFDHTLSAAAAHNEKVVVTLGNQWGDCDSSDRYKPLSWYQGAYATQIDPGYLTTYRQWVNDVVTRYKDNPAILMWQFMNEAEAKNADGSCTESSAASALGGFAAAIGQLTKAIDQKHLTNLGTMGNGQCGGAGTDYQMIHSSPYIDLCEDHDYGTPTQPMPGDQYNGLQLRIAQCAALNKPLFMGETGITCSEVGGSVTTRASDFAAKFPVLFGAGVVGEVMWDWYDAAHGGSCASGGYGIGPGDPALALLSAW
jgi:mannan endo-1,4-beta-mannosidase